MSVWLPSGSQTPVSSGQPFAGRSPPPLSPACSGLPAGDSRPAPARFQRPAVRPLAPAPAGRSLSRSPPQSAAARSRSPAALSRSLPPASCRISRLSLPSLRPLLPLACPFLSLPLSRSRYPLLSVPAPAIPLIPSPLSLPSSRSRPHPAASPSRSFSSPLSPVSRSPDFDPHSS